MSDETVLTPITPDEGGAAPPKVTPSVMAASASAPTVKLKPVIRKPLIRKPVIGGAKPVTLKPATGTPPPPAAVPEAAAPVAEPPAVPAAEPVAAPAAPQLKSTTSPISAQAALRKTGIVAEGILTPAQAQAAKTKTSRISLESAIGVAPATKSAAPMKTIRLRRPTDIPPAPSAINLLSVRLSRLTPLLRLWIRQHRPFLLLKNLRLRLLKLLLPIFRRTRRLLQRQLSLRRNLQLRLRRRRPLSFVVQTSSVLPSVDSASRVQLLQLQPQRRHLLQMHQAPAWMQLPTFRPSLTYLKSGQCQRLPCPLPKMIRRPYLALPFGLTR